MVDDEELGELLEITISHTFSYTHPRDLHPCVRTINSFEFDDEELDYEDVGQVRLASMNNYEGRHHRISGGGDEGESTLRRRSE